MTRKLFLFVWRLLSALLGVSAELLRCGRVVFYSHGSVVAENLFLRRQLAFYEERNSKPRRLTDSVRFALLFWSCWFPWRSALVVVKPETLIGRHRRAFQLFWLWKSRDGRPKLPKNLRVLIVEMVRGTPPGVQRGLLRSWLLNSAFAYLRERYEPTGLESSDRLGFAVNARRPLCETMQRPWWLAISLWP